MEEVKKGQPQPQHDPEPPRQDPDYRREINDRPPPERRTSEDKGDVETP